MRILVVEDDKQLNNQITKVLRSQGYGVDTAFDGEEALFLGINENYSVIILDIGIPIINGHEILRQWRESDVESSVIVLTARDRWNEKVAAIDAGADDYITKPFYFEELLARIRAVVRRYAGHASNEINCGDLTIDLRSTRVKVDNCELVLTALEYKLLLYLVQHQGRVISRFDINEELYGHEFDRDSNIIEVLIARLRKKIGLPLIKTVRGLGYTITADDDLNNRQNGQ